LALLKNSYKKCARINVDETDYRSTKNLKIQLWPFKKVQILKKEKKSQIKFQFKRKFAKVTQINFRISKNVMVVAQINFA